MNLRRIIKLLLPPIVIHLYRKINPAKMEAETSNYVWEGVFDHYNDVPLSVTGYEGYLGNARAKAEHDHAKGLLNNSAQQHTDPHKMTSENLLLPLLVSSINAGEKKTSILDFGGGIGIQYIHLVNCLEGNWAITYKVVELPNACEQGASLFQDDKAIEFVTELPAEVPELDIVFMKSALQYVEDYQGLLQRLCSYQAKYILFAKLSAGDNPTYATVQKNMPGMEMAFWCINVDELITYMSQHQYKLIYKSYLDIHHNQDNFPESHRMGPPCNLLFERIQPPN